MPRKKKEEMLGLPVIPLRGLMVFPHMVLHFDVGRPRSVAALEEAMMGDQKVLLVAQKDGDVEDPTLEDMCKVGTVAQVKQVLNLPGDSIRVLVEGICRAQIRALVQEEPCWKADVVLHSETLPNTPEMAALVRFTHEMFDQYAAGSARISQETLRSVKDVDQGDQLADLIAANVLTKV